MTQATHTPGPWRIQDRIGGRRMNREQQLASALRDAAFALESAAMLAGIRALAEPAADARKALERYYRSKQEGLDA